MSSTGYDFWADENAPQVMPRSTVYCIKPPELANHTIYMEVHNAHRECNLLEWWWGGTSHKSAGEGASFLLYHIWTYLEEWELVEKVYHNPEDYHYKATKKLTGPEE